jgi:S1-C subfamily serine protease
VDAALELQKEVLKKKIGAKVQLKVWRGGKAIQVPVAMEELPEKLAVAADKRPGKLGVESRAESLGMSLRDARRTGAAVVAVVPGSPADRAALQTDDVITEIAGRPVRSAAAADEAIGDRLRASGKKPVVLKVERHAKQISVEITPKP